MNLMTMMKPIKQDLAAFQVELDKFVASVSNKKIKENYRTFFKHRGKHLRPSLLFLASGAVAVKEIDKVRMYKLGLVLELLHSASLVHDDIIDGDDTRRGHRTINSVFGNKVGVLAGDALFSYAFALATDLFNQEYNRRITNLTLRMCEAELIQANGVDSRDSYLTVIEGKTALFMSVACELGAMYAEGSESEVATLRSFGLNLGMAYQIIDDFIDSDENALKYITRDEAVVYLEKAKENLTTLRETPHKNSLVALLQYVVKMNG